jgi:hypothetical protein
MPGGNRNSVVKILHYLRGNLPWPSGPSGLGDRFASDLPTGVRILSPLGQGLKPRPSPAHGTLPLTLPGGFGSPPGRAGADGL